MNAEENHGAHSARVEMELIVDGISIGITHMGHDFLLVETPAEFPACQASIRMKVDDSESQWEVRLPLGISKDSRRVALAVSGS